MKQFNIRQSITSLSRMVGKHKYVALEIAHSLGLIIAAQLVVNVLLISVLREEWFLIYGFSVSGDLDLIFALLAVCSVLRILCAKGTRRIWQTNPQLKTPIISQSAISN